MKYPYLSGALLSGFSIFCFTAFYLPVEKHFEPYTEDIPGSEIQIQMVPIPGGIYKAGSPESESGRRADEGPAHDIEVKPFWMSKYEITWDQYELFLRRAIDDIKASNIGQEVQMEVDAVSAATTPYVDMSFGMGKEGYPVINVTQYAASTFCKWLSAKTGHFYRLPTEAEWEYACRAGQNTTFHFGNNADDLNEYAWFEDNSGGAYKKVGLKKPNKWGLHDMHGNVAEWTLDQYAADFYVSLQEKSATSYWNVADKLYPRVLKGGSWKDKASDLRCAARMPSSPDWKKRDPQIPKSLWWHTDAPFVGFRIVRPKNVPPAEEMEKYWVAPLKEY